MSENLLATVLTLAIILAIVGWVPLLNLICPACTRFLEKRRRQLPTGRRTVYTATQKEAA